MNAQEKYFAILHTGKKTSYSGNNSYIFRNAGSSFTADNFPEIERRLREKGWWLGYLGYGLKNSLEKLPQDEDFFISAPDSWFGKFEQAECSENYRLPEPKSDIPAVAYIKSNMSKAEYIEKVEKIRSYIANGDIYQANLTRKFYGEFADAADGYDIFCHLNKTSPAPYSAYLKIDDLHIISSSPELFIRADINGNAVTCPIKGTGGKGKGAVLKTSDKDISENLMITDLMRNDFSRVCRPGSVKVDRLFEVDEFETVSHMHSVISGSLNHKNDRIEVLKLVKNCFPPGSMTGAPKIRAMEICSELEKHKRGIYSGALGYFAPDGFCEFSVVIRTLIIRGRKFEFQVGGGITFESEPEKEWQETMLKAQAIAEMFGILTEVEAL